MNKELQYRTGRWPQPEGIPDEVLEQLRMLDDDIAADRALLRRCHELLAEMALPDAAGVIARRRLGLGKADPECGLLAHARGLIAADPAREAEVWEAMWAARRHSSLEAEYRTMLRQVAAIYEQRQQWRELGFPADWAPAHCGLWRECGGSAATARAWSRAGWASDEVLGGRVLDTNGRNLALSARVTMMAPPRRGLVPVRIPADGRRNRYPLSIGGTR